MAMEVDLYEYFGIPIESSSRDIKRAYKAKAKKLHPDKNKDNQKAKEEFQKLKEYYDILLDPVQRAQYDLKIKAKLAVIKRNAEMDSERRKLREQLEAREREAALRQKEAQQHHEKERVAARIRKEWEAQAEAAAFAARQERLRREEEESLSANRVYIGADSVVTVKWNTTDVGRSCYSKDFVLTCLSEFGSITNLVMGKRGSAVVEFSSRFEAIDAVDRASTGCVGYPDNPLLITLVGGGKRQTNPQPPPSPQHPSAEPTATGGDFADFESDILSQMASFQ
uniref:DnaJ homolog subfamily A member 3 n=1 Tax=Schistocephalus solidus TaxID=70667 RepID=A0A0X3PA06_SCHSO